MQTVEGLSWITVLDLVMGFWHIPLDEESQKLTAFVLPWGKYCYNCLPMGLSVSPDTYQKNIKYIHQHG
jgi:Reverse transcriptase (RNA-dependent DNA polymerase)